MDLAREIEALLPLVEKPARYLDHEIHAIHREWRPESVHWLLVLPDVYEIGMSHLGIRILYDVLNRDPASLAERAFAPWVDMEARMRAHGLPLFSLESRRPARDFEIIGFSWPYELLATNLLNLLDLARIPLRSEERGEDDPLIAAGGPCTGNPEPLAEFVDFFLIGDGEAAVLTINRALEASRGRPRAERLLALARIPGVYVPRFYAPVYRDDQFVSVEPRADVPFPVRRTYLEDLDRAPYPAHPVVPLIEAVQDRLALEIQRGCTHGCRFCQAGIFYRPMRERSPRTLIDLVTTGLVATGWDELSLSSLSSADYSQIEPLARTLTEGLAATRIGISFSSLRADTFGVGLAELVARVRKTGLTFAPEAGTQRLRDVINKGIRDEDLLQAVEGAYARGWRRVKLYFMVGLPTESEDDLDGIVELVGRLRPPGRTGGKRITVSVGAFVPKAHTPFQWEAFAGRGDLHERMRTLRERLSTSWSEMKGHAVEPSFIEAILARGDRRCARLVQRVWELGGRFEGWSEHFDIGRWERALAESGLTASQFTGAREPDAPLPWDHIDLGVTKAWLQSEREKALRAETTRDCRTGACSMCGMGGPKDRRITRPLSRADWQALRDRLRAEVGSVSGTAGPGDAVAAGVTRAGDGAAAGKAAEAVETSERPLLHYRLCYRKQGPLRFIAHLETGRLLARLLRLARWPIAFSLGHNPHPRIAYGPPLPLGVEGERELVDLQLVASTTEDDLARLNACAPRGLEFLSLRAIASATRSLAAAAHAATYHVYLPPDLIAQARQEKRIEAFLGAGALLVAKPSKGRQRNIDLKRAVASIACDGAAVGTVRNGGVMGDGIADAGQSASPALCMTLRLQESDGHVLGPLPVLREIFHWSPEDLARCRAVRVRLLDQDGVALDTSS